MKIFRVHYSRMAIGVTIALVGGLSIGVGNTLAQGRPGQGSPPSGPSQPGKPSPGGKPSDGPQIQPVRPQPGKPPAGKPPDRPQTGPGRPQPGNPSPGKPPSIQPVRPPQTPPGKPGYRPPPPRPRPPYQWHPGDADRLRRHYHRGFIYINPARRPVFVIGGYIPFGDRQYFTPVPVDLLRYLPPVPPGYAIGYFYGYCVVYDPVTFTIINFIDLLH